MDILNNGGRPESNPSYSKIQRFAARINAENAKKTTIYIPRLTQVTIKAVNPSSFLEGTFIFYFAPEEDKSCPDLTYFGTFCPPSWRDHRSEWTWDGRRKKESRS